MPTYPNVPNVPGVPPLLRNPLSPPVSTALAVADAVLTLVNFFLNQWGLFYSGGTAQAGAPVLVPDSVEEFDYHNTWKVANYPLEMGAFESYDKVQTPYEVMIRMMVGGTVGERSAFIIDVESAASSLTLYDVVTPERTYLNATIERYEYDRKAHAGLGLLVIDLHLVEVRVNATAQFTNTQAPSGAATTNGGQATPATPTQAQSNAIQGVQ
jgi:hypothetical protein